MFTRISRSGGRSYLQLVEYFREGDKVKQRLVASLGRFDETKVKSLIASLERSIGRVPDSELSEVPAVSFSSALAYGDLYALQCLWQELGWGLR